MVCRSPSEAYLSVLCPGEAHGGGEERAVVHGAGTGVMSGGGTEKDFVACPLGSTSLFFWGLPMFLALLNRVQLCASRPGLELQGDTSNPEAIQATPPH